MRTDLPDGFRTIVMIDLELANKEGITFHLRMCQDHWTELYNAIALRELDHLVAEDTEQACDSLQSAIENNLTYDDFDPLMYAHWLLCYVFISQTADPKPQHCCPMCVVEDFKSGLAENWITGAADAQLSIARELGLAPLLN